MHARPEMEYWDWFQCNRSEVLKSVAKQNGLRGAQEDRKKERLTWESDEEWSKHHTYTVLWNRDTQLEC
jgi:hypothetical protein